MKIYELLIAILAVVFFWGAVAYYVAKQTKKLNFNCYVRKRIEKTIKSNHDP